MLRLELFTIGICKLTGKMSLILPLGPTLGDLCANRTRRSADLTRESIFFLSRKPLGKLEYPLRDLKRAPADQQVPKTASIFEFHFLDFLSVACATRPTDY